jgi:hypothetical protein
MDTHRLRKSERTDRERRSSGSKATTRAKTGVLEIGVTRPVGRDQYVMRPRIPVNGNEFERQGVDGRENAIIGHQQKLAIHVSKRRQRRSIL